MTTAPLAVERRHPPNAVMKLVNPLVRRVVARGKGRAADQLALLHYTGRKSGRQFDVPVGVHDVDGQLSVLTNAPWRHNFAGGAEIEVTFKGERRPATATLVDGADEVASIYERQFRELGVKDAQRRMGVKVTVGRQPTHDEIVDAVRRQGLSVVRLDLR